MLRVASLAVAFVCSSTFGSAAMAAEQNQRSSSSERFRLDPLTRHVLNLDVTFNWIAGSDRFWFKRQTRSGDEFVVVDAATARESSAFDGGALRAALNAAVGGTVDVPEVPIYGLTFEEGGSRVVLQTSKGPFACDVPVTRCSSHVVSAGADVIVSPDGRSAVLRRDNDLWLRELPNGPERRLTRDGVPDFGYGDVDRSLDLQRVARRRTGAPAPLLGVVWSPDSRYVVALRQDFRPFPNRLLVTEYVPPGGVAPNGDWAPTHFGKFAIAADAATPDSQLIVIDVRTSTVRRIGLDPQALNSYAVQYLNEGVLWWRTDKLFLITSNRGDTRYGVSSIELRTGEVHEILHETARFNVRLNPYDYFRPNVHVSSKGDEIVWYSERTGYGHLYLYDAATGRVKRQITHGNWVVFDLLRVDESKRLAYFTAGPRNGQGNPYYRYLYRVSLDGGEPRLLTPEIANHEFGNGYGRVFQYPSTSSIAPSGGYFVDSYSTTDQPSRVVVRKSSGELVGEVLATDASALYATGWRPPERVVVKAADGVTDLYGVMIRPSNFDPSRRYPVIDLMYPGPQGRWAPLSFLDFPQRFLNMFADAGFIVVLIDGRGTAYRSREFRDAFLGTEDVFGAADQVAAIRNLAARYPYLDLEHVGAVGVSLGGYGSLRAMLLYPDFFKVVVSAAGHADWLDFPSGISTERFFGVAAASSQARAYYDVVSNTRLVSRLRGRLLLIYGGIDENVPLTQAFELFDAFIKADKNVDMLIMPGSAHHGVLGEPYALRRSVQYFVDHLAERPTAHE